MSNWRRHRAFIGEKVPENGPFRDQSFGGAWGIWPRSGANRSTRGKPYTDELQILCSCVLTRFTAQLVPKRAIFGTRHCIRIDENERCHPRSAARQGWVCLSDIHCSRCPRSWSAAGSPNLCTNLKLRVQLSSTNWRRHRAFIGEKVPENGPFRDIWPRSGANRSKRNHTLHQLQIFVVHTGSFTAVFIRSAARHGCAYRRQGVRSWSFHLGEKVHN